MDKQVRKAFLIGLGITLLSKDKVEEEVKRFMKAHDITEAEGKKLAKQMMSEGMKHSKQLEKHIRAVEKDLRASTCVKKAKVKTKKAKAVKKKAVKKTRRR